MLGLTEAPAGPEARARRTLDARLQAGAPWPLAIALSGGGDSVALLLIAHAWAREIGRPLLALTVDHRLQPQSADWAAGCAELCARLGVAHRTLVWTGDKPATGLPAAARAARHRLIADAARGSGARAVLLGHTADDVREAAAMRAAGSTTPSPRAWSPSPAWPQGRGLFVLRPLLDVRRAELRRWLTERGARWIEDPANEDPRYARARVRREGVAPALAAEDDLPPLASLARAVRIEPCGMIALPRDTLRTAPADAARRFAAAASLCAAGGSRPPSRAAAERLTERLRAEGPVRAVLAGARVEADVATIRWMREPGEAARGGLANLHLAAGEIGVWDGRFEVTATRAATVSALRGRLNALDGSARERLKAVPPAARAAAPELIDGLTARFLGGDRLLAACGAVEREV